MRTQYTENSASDNRAPQTIIDILLLKVNSRPLYRSFHSHFFNYRAFFIEMTQPSRRDRV